MKRTPTGQLLDAPLSEIKEINVEFSNKLRNLKKWNKKKKETDCSFDSRRGRFTHLHTIPHWWKTSRCHGSHRGTRSGTSRAS